MILLVDVMDGMLVVSEREREVKEGGRLSKNKSCSRQLTDADEGVPLPFSSVADADE